MAPYERWGFLPFLVISASLLVQIPLSFGPVFASQSRITEADGYACMGDDKSRKQTEQAALADAKRNAVEAVRTFVVSETEVKDFELKSDMVKAYANASVTVVKLLNTGWYKDPQAGDCYRAGILADVVPDETTIEAAAKRKRADDDPSAPLSVRLWTDKAEYRERDKIKVYLKGNKPFFARVIYKDAKGGMLQILPNPYRKSNYFHGGVVYEIPSDADRFDLEVSPPFGGENVVVYASTTQIGEVDMVEAGGVYRILFKAEEIPIKTRGLKLTDRKEAAEAAQGRSRVTEFSEEAVALRTSK